MVFLWFSYGHLLVAPRACRFTARSVAPASSASCKKHEVGQCEGTRHFGDWASHSTFSGAKKCYSKSIQSLFVYI